MNADEENTVLHEMSYVDENGTYCIRHQEFHSSMTALVKRRAQFESV